jgi:hypothetical protein
MRTKKRKSIKHLPKPQDYATRAGVERVAITPTEFAAKFGRHAIWAYRRIYAGEIKVLAGFRPALIPLTEVDRFLARAKPFVG